MNIKEYLDILKDLWTPTNASKIRMSISNALEMMGNNLKENIDRQDNVENQFQDVLDETTGKDVINGPEIIAARNGETNLKARLDKEKNEVAAQLDHTDNKLNLKGWELQNKKRKIKPMVTFVDDDAYRQVLTHLKPLSQQYDIPFVVAAISGRVEKEVSYSLNADELRHLQNDLGWEISSHTVNHYHLGELSDEEQEFELRKSKETLEAMGLNISTICYPYGSLNDKTHEFVRKYYRAGRTTDFRNRMNLTPTETYDLLVTPLGSWFDKWSGSPFPTNSLEFYKYQVDKAIEQKAWLIFMTHVGGNDQHDETQQQYLEETIKYVLEKNLDVVTLDQGMDLRGNLIDVGRYQRRDLSHEHFVVGADGSYSGSHLQNIFKYMRTGNMTGELKPSDFPIGQRLISRIGFGVSSEYYPDAHGGKLITDTTAQLLPMNDHMGYTFQEFSVRGKPDVWTRYALTEEEWSDWTRTDSQIHLMEINSATTDTVATSFPNRKISYCRISPNNTTAFPGGNGGVLTTNRIVGSLYDVYQEYEKTAWPNDRYKRTWDQSSNSWYGWKKYVFE